MGIAHPGIIAMVHLSLSKFGSRTDHNNLSAYMFLIRTFASCSTTNNSTHIIMTKTNKEHSLCCLKTADTSIYLVANHRRCCVTFDCFTFYVTYVLRHYEHFYTDLACSRVATLILYCREPGDDWSSKICFAESYRLCVPELKSVGWQCAILGQLVGTTKIQDGCRDHGKLQNVFIVTLHHARNIMFVCTRML